MIPLEKNKCVIVLKEKKEYIPVIGINQTTGGYFLNYYLNKYDPWYGENPHISRHKDLVAFRYDEEKDWFSMGKDWKTIDEKKTFENLPCCSITSDLYLKSVDKKWIKRKVSLPIYVPFKKCRQAVLARVKIWPKHLDPNIKELKAVWQMDKNPERLVDIFTPNCFTNKVSVAIYSTDIKQVEIPLISGPMKFSGSGPFYGPPILYRGPRKGRK